MLEAVLAVESSVMDWVWAIVIGGIIGWVASLVAGSNAQMGIVANILVGIVGSLLGHWLAGVLGIGAGSLAARLAVSLGGAILLIIILRGLRILR